MKLALLDKDGTLVISAEENGFINKPEQQIIKPGSLDSVKRLLSQDFTLVIVSNQGGVEKRFKSLDTVFDEMMYCNNLFVKELNMPVFERIYFCPDFQGNTCYVGEISGYSTHSQSWIGGKPWDLSNTLSAQKLGTKGKFRKPCSGMLEQAIWYYSKNSVDKNKLEKVIMIGDREEDKQAAENVQIQFYWIEEAISMVNILPLQ
jgi:D-glycero-D-manno-heptose 1,7-bisphosphate phosphatase